MQTGTRTIMLVDMNAFYISCETARAPELEGIPAAVAGDPKRRAGIILSGNYEARAFGVKTAMTVNEALRLCPMLELVPPDKDYYGQKSQDILTILKRFTPVIEPNSIDEAWLDMTGTEHLWGRPEEAAQKIMDTIRREERLGCSIGIAPNKYLAKMASDMKKPQGITRLSMEDVPVRLWPLPVREMPGVGRRTDARLEALGIQTIGDLAGMSPSYLETIFGRTGLSLYHHAHGQGSDRVEVPDADDIKSISRETTLSHNVTDPAEAAAIILPLADDVARQARAHSKKGRTVQITLRYAEDLRRITRQRQVAPTDSARLIYETGRELLEQVWDSEKPVRLIGIGLTGFDSAKDDSDAEQIGLDELLAHNTAEGGRTGPAAVRPAVNPEPVLDEIRAKLGDGAVFRGSALKHHPARQRDNAAGGPLNIDKRKRNMNEPG